MPYAYNPPPPTPTSFCHVPAESKLKKCCYTRSCMLKLDYDKRLCNFTVNVSEYRWNHLVQVTLPCSQTAQLPFKFRCNVHSARAKSEINSYTNRSRSFCSLFNSSVVRWIRSDTFKSCLSLIFTRCRPLHGMS